jgi:hypothetical protein
VPPLRTDRAAWATSWGPSSLQPLALSCDEPVRIAPRTRRTSWHCLSGSRSQAALTKVKQPLARVPVPSIQPAALHLKEGAPNFLPNPLQYVRGPMRNCQPVHARQRAELLPAEPNGRSGSMISTSMTKSPPTVLLHRANED